MKKLFSGIGILLAIFSAYFFLLVADKMVYITQDTIYDFILEDSSISVKELEAIAKATNTMIQLRSYEDLSFGKQKINIILLHPDVAIKEGRQDSVFPRERITYQTAGYNKKTQVQFFTIQERHREKIEQVKKMLQEKDCTYNIEEDEPIHFSFSMLFSQLNAKFFILLLILSFLCIVTYYIYRLKEIGILKLNGWENAKISRRIMWGMFQNTSIASAVLMAIVSIYIGIMDIKRLPMYLYMCALLLCFVLVVYVFAACIATCFIKNVNQVSAIKNGKNTKFIFYCLVFVKVLTTSLLLLSFHQLSTNVQMAQNAIKSAKTLKSYQLYTLDTFISPTKENTKKLETFLETLSDDEVYNYGSAEALYSYEKVRKKRPVEEYSMEDMEYNIIMLSENILPILKVKDTNGNLVKTVGLKPEEEKILIPKHLEQYTKELLAYWDCSKDTLVCYIQDGQIYQDLHSPGKYSYDSILFVHGVKKQLYLNAEEVLYKKSVVSKLKAELEELKIGEGGSIEIASKNNEIDNIIATYEIDAWESGIFLIINAISYALSAVSIITIYFEFRKKRFGVYTLLGKIPWKDILLLATVNILIVSVLAAIIDIRYMVFVLFELAIYFVSVHSYIRRKAILSMKGA